MPYGSSKLYTNFSRAPPSGAASTSMGCGLAPVAAPPAASCGESAEAAGASVRACWLASASTVVSA